jgi:hypothetical protein
LELLDRFLSEEISPADFAQLIDKFLFDYMSLLIRFLCKESDGVNVQTHDFIYYLKALRDILQKCEGREES